MASTNAAADDFIEIVEHKESIIGRDLVVRDMGMSHRGPISDIRKTTGGKLIITIEWRAANHVTGSAEAWYLTDDKPYQYSADLDKAVLRFTKDGGIDIIVAHGWVGRIPPADATPLEKPAS